MKRALALALILSTALALGAAGQTQQKKTAAEAYRDAVSEIQLRGRSLGQAELASLIETRLQAIIQKYPGTPEAARAHLELGRFASSTGATQSAIRHIEEFLRAKPQVDAGIYAQARYILGTSYSALERYDEAEATLKLITGPGVDRRLGTMASSELSRIPTLRKLKIGLPAVEFTAATTDGKKVKVADYRGKVLLIDFFAAWCNPCRQEMPNVLKTYDELHKKGFEILGISLDENRANFDAYVRETGIKWSVVYDGKKWESEIGRLYAISSIPATFLIDRAGKIRYKNVRGEALARAVNALLSEK